MNCIKCGNQINDTDPFCPYCGEKVDNASAQPAQPAAAPQVEELTPAEPTTPVVEQPVAPATPVVEAAPAVAPVTEPVAAPVAEPAPVVEQPAAPVVAEPAPVAPAAPVVEQPAVPQQVVVPQDPATMVTPNPAAQATPVQPTPATPEQPEKKQGKGKVVLLIVLLIIAAIVAYVMFGSSLFKTEEPTTPTTPTEPEPQEVVNTEKTETFMGYTFTIPDGYDSKVDSTYGLTIGNSEVAYSILIDLTNSYEKYVEALKIKYPAQAANLEQTVGTRKFVIGELTSTTGARGSQYVSPASTTATFIGIVANKNNTIEYNDYKVLANILDSSKESGTSFAAGDANDPGKSGPVFFEIDRAALGFAE